MDKQNPAGPRSLSTRRLILRAPALTDREQMATIRSDDEVNKYISRQPCLSVAEAEAFIKKIVAGIANSGWFYWAICLEEDDKLIGTVCLWNIDETAGRAELGYELLPAFQGKGIMSEALEKVIDFAFNQLYFKSIVAVTHQNNRKSVALLEKFGFSRNKPGAAAKDLGPDEIALTLQALSIS